MKGRIPQHFIDELLARVDLIEVIDRRVPLKKSGRNYTARCPFHEEKTPSFSVNPDKQFYYCFGCGASGNAISFLMEYDRQEFPQAIDSLAASAGMEVPREQAEDPAKAQRRRDIYSLMDETTAFYKRQLSQHAQSSRAVDYLRGRGLSGEIARDFDIGFAPPGWDNLLKALGGDSSGRTLLNDAGLLVERDDGRAYDRFRDRIIFPIRDNRGRVIAFGGRVLGDDKPKYLNSPETEIFHKGRELYGLYQARRAERSLQRLIIVEGYMDVVALAQHGIRCAVATLGTATSVDHLRKVFRYVSEVVFCFDGDEAGRKAARRAMETALPVMEDGRQARFLFMPEGEDPDSLVRSIGATRFENLVRDAQPLEDYLFAALAAEVNPDSLEGKAKLSKLAAPLLQQLPDGVFKQLMLDALARRTGLSSEALQSVLAQNPPTAEPASSDSAPRAPTANKPGKPKAATAPAPAAQSQRDPVLYAIALLLHSPRALAALTADTEALSAVDSPYLPTLRALISLLQQRPESSTAMLTGHWYGQPEYEVIRQASGLMQVLAERPDSLSEETVAAELDQTLAFLQQRLAKTRYQALVEQLRQRGPGSLSEEEKQLLRRPPHLH